jgi:hypothetical protein
MSVIQGIHTVRKLRPGKEPIWYVYAYRGGPLIHREIGWKRPSLGVGTLRKLIDANDDRVGRLPTPETIGAVINSWQGSPEWQGLASSTQRTWVICPLLSGPESLLFWTTKEEWNGQEAQAGGDHWQAA